MIEWNDVLAQRLHAPLRAWFAEQSLWTERNVEPVWQETRKEFEGELTLVLFGPAKAAGVKPELLATMLESFWPSLTLENGSPLIRTVRLAGGFLNLGLSYAYWRQRWSMGYSLSTDLVHVHADQANLPKRSKIVLEYSSPNTNKPLHLGHVRNNLLGDSMYRILKSLGHEVVRVQVINDRGIHICKSMLAWQKFGEGVQPKDVKTKGDHFVGHYYVLYEKAFQAQVEEAIKAGATREEAEATAPILQEARTMLQQWELGDEAVVNLWKMMNSWVYEGFDTTYDRLGIGFDRNYYESQTYVLGKNLVEQGLAQGVFRKDEKGAVWADLQDIGLDSKILLRSDGTSVYITQDLGTADQRQKDWGFDRMIYTVADEQNYHFKVLFAILDKLGFAWASRCHHLSYGMVDLPSGRMKSREGKVVDADDLMDEVQSLAEAKMGESEKLQALALEERQELALQIGLAALKFYILKVDPSKRMTFNPEDSIDMQGHTGPFVQYAHARIASMLARVVDLEPAEPSHPGLEPWSLDLHRDWLPAELELVRQFSQFAPAVNLAAEKYNPAHVADFAYSLATAFNRFYHDCPVLQENHAETRSFRIGLCQQTRQLLSDSLDLLGIKAPQRM
jgi:arginyl-tRNA synthetase